MQRIELKKIKISDCLKNQLSNAINWLNKATGSYYRSTEFYSGDNFASEHAGIILFVVQTDSRPPEYEMIGIKKNDNLEVLFPSYIQADFSATCDLIGVDSKEEIDEFITVLSTLLEKTLIPFKPPRKDISKADRCLLDPNK